MKTKIITTLLLGTTLFTACERNFSVDTGTPYTLPAEYRDLQKKRVTADNQFSFDLFQQMAQTGPDSNCFISPFSASMALGMTLNGANGETETAMRNTLRFGGMDQEAINAIYHSMIDDLLFQKEGALFEIANSIWYRQGFDVLQTFIDVNRSSFDAMVRALDFSRPEAKDIINAWITEKTHGLIENTIDQINPLVMMYLINAIYFKAEWTISFNPEKTVDTQFNAPQGAVDCKMMRMDSRLMYFETDDFQAVDLGYGKGRFSMSVFLPKTGKTTDALTALFTYDNWTRWITQFDSTDIQLGLPRFKIEHKTLLNQPLIDLGMGIAFGVGGEPDFTGIHPGGRLFISRVIHQTFVEVNEEGTEAAAVTVVEMKFTSVPDSVTMWMNRPFLFTIWDHETGAILFMGKLVNPAIN